MSRSTGPGIFRPQHGIDDKLGASSPRLSGSMNTASASLFAIARSVTESGLSSVTTSNI